MKRACWPRTTRARTARQAAARRSRHLRAFPEWARGALVAAAVAFGGASVAQTGRLELNPAATVAGELEVRAGRGVSITVDAPATAADASGQVSATRAGREVWNVALERRGASWHATGSFPDAGPHVLSVRLYEGGRTLSAAVDVSASTASGAAGAASVPLEFAVTSGRKGGDVNGWWGIAVMLVLVAVIAAGTVGLRTRRARHE